MPLETDIIINFTLPKLFTKQKTTVMQKQIITKAENGFVIDHNNKVYIDKTVEDIAGNYIRDLKNIVANMKPGERLAVELSWELNPVEIRYAVMPEIDIKSTLARIGELRVNGSNITEFENFNEAYLTKVLKNVVFK